MCSSINVICHHYYHNTLHDDSHQHPRNSVSKSSDSGAVSCTRVRSANLVTQPHYHVVGTQPVAHMLGTQQVIGTQPVAHVLGTQQIVGTQQVPQILGTRQVPSYHVLGPQPTTQVFGHF